LEQQATSAVAITLLTHWRGFDSFQPSTKNRLLLQEAYDAFDDKDWCWYASTLRHNETHIDTTGRLLMGQITLIHGLLKHIMHSLPVVMCILGNINHSTLLHLPSPCAMDTKSYAPADLPKGTMRVNDLEQHDLNETWPTYLMNKAHMQIQNP
jgi:hypothetical protein